jgi:hypothetical protein
MSDNFTKKEMFLPKINKKEKFMFYEEEIEFDYSRKQNTIKVKIPKCYRKKNFIAKNENWQNFRKKYL